MATEKNTRINCLAVDGSSTSQLAFDWYTKNYHRKTDTLVLTHIHLMPELPMMGILSGLYPTNTESQKKVEESIKASEAITDKFKKLCKERGIDSCEVVLEDNYKSPGYMICDIAHKHNANVIVMGQRGLGAVERTFVGSTSDYVLHHANMPVIVVPPTTPSQEPTSYY